MEPRRSTPTVVAALAFTLFVPLTGLLYLGSLVATIFLVGYGGGWVMWLVRPAVASFERIKVPYWLTVAAFVLHKVEENRARFFETLSREVTGVAVPEATPLLFVAMLIVPAGAWLLVPWLMGRCHALGTYLAYTLFASMALSELAHFVFPLLTGHAYGYFPGMVTVFVLAPLGGWGLWRLWSSPAPRSTGPAPG